jgi:hypothetical protein
MPNDDDDDDEGLRFGKGPCWKNVQTNCFEPPVAKKVRVKTKEGQWEESRCPVLVRFFSVSKLSFKMSIVIPYRSQVGDFICH